MGGMTLHSCSSHWDTSVTLQELALRGPLSGLATYHLIVKCVPMQRSGVRTANSPRGLRLKHRRGAAGPDLSQVGPCAGPHVLPEFSWCSGKSQSQEGSKGAPEWQVT